MLAASFGSVLQLRTKPSSQLNASSPITRLAGVRSTAPVNRFVYGTRLRAVGSERLQLWRSDGPGRAPKLRMVVRSMLSAVPEKPQGLYDPKMDKDSCGVGFVAELSGESSRKTITDALEMLVRMTHRGACWSNFF